MAVFAVPVAAGATEAAPVAGAWVGAAAGAPWLVGGAAVAGAGCAGWVAVVGAVVGCPPGVVGTDGAAPVVCVPGGDAAAAVVVVPCTDAVTLVAATAGGARAARFARKPAGSGA